MSDINDAPSVESLDMGNRALRVYESARELLDTYYVREMTPSGTIIATDFPLLDQVKESPGQDMWREIGSTGQTVYNWMTVREDYNAELRGSLGLKMYDKMRKSDAQVRASLRLVKTPVLAARWYVEPSNPDPTDLERKQAAFVQRNLWYMMTTSFPQMLTEILLMLDYGHYLFEKVYSKVVIDGEERIIWRKFAPRHPLDVWKWDWDSHGGPAGVTLYNPIGAEDSVYIGIQKLAIFTFDKEAGNVEGVSVLRSAYKHWYYKDNLYKIDAIQKERHGVGIPVVKLPPGFKPADVIKADELGRNLRSNEKAHVVLPPNWEIAMLKMEGQPVDAMVSVEHHDMMIARNVLGQFINTTGTASAEAHQDIFLKATRYIADTIRDVFNKYCIPQLIYWNWGDQEYYPELRVRRIGDTVDWRTISFAMRNFVGAGLLIPDEKLEKWIRDEMDLPVMDMDTQRIIVAPQMPSQIPDGAPDGNPGPGGAGAAAAHQNGGLGGKPGVPRVGSPRQSSANRQKQGPGGTGVGNDKSGGK